MRAAFAPILLAVALAASWQPARADTTAGVRAFERGDWATARAELTRPATVEGSAEAQYLLGLMYRDGKGVARDAEQAMKWLRMAAALGEGRAMLALGRAYERGEPVRRDKTKAMAWYRLAGDALPAGALRDTARRGHDRVAYLAPRSHVRKAAQLADEWGANLVDTAMVLRIQDGLAAFGYPVGPIDGIVGPKTRGAITSYQKQNGLAVTGEATADLQTHILGQRAALP